MQMEFHDVHDLNRRWNIKLIVKEMLLTKIYTQLKQEHVKFVDFMLSLAHSPIQQLDWITKELEKDRRTRNINCTVPL